MKGWKCVRFHPWLRLGSGQCGFPCGPWGQWHLGAVCCWGEEPRRRAASAAAPPSQFRLGSARCRLLPPISGGSAACSHLSRQRGSWVSLWVREQASTAVWQNPVTHTQSKQWYHSKHALSLIGHIYLCFFPPKAHILNEKGNNLSPKQNAASLYSG